MMMMMMMPANLIVIFLSDAWCKEMFSPLDVYHLDMWPCLTQQPLICLFYAKFWLAHGVRTATWYGAGWFHWWTWKCLEEIMFILPTFSQQIGISPISESLPFWKWEEKLAVFNHVVTKKNLLQHQLDVFFTRFPWNFQTLPLVTWGYYHQGDLHTFSTGGRSWFVVRKKIRAQTVWENHRWIRQRCHKQIRHVFLQKRWWHWYLMLRLFQAMAKTLIFHKLPFLHRFGCF